MSDAFELPAVPDDLGTAWLEAALHRGGVDATARLVASEREVVNAAVGLMGEITRCTLRWDAPASAEVPDSVIAKLPSALTENRALGLAMGFYEAEHRFYGELAPRLGMRTPRTWYTGGDAEAGRYALLLEDLGALEAVDQVTGGSAHHAAQAVDALASMHARWWDAPELASLTWIPRGIGDDLLVYGSIMEAAWPAFAAATESILTAADRSLVEQFLAAFPRLVAETANDPTTIVHRDFRIDNMFFDGQGPVVIDWGGLAVGAGFYDFAYFVGGSLTVPDQRAQWDGLVERYLDGLAAGGVEVPTGDELRRGLVVGALFCLIIPVMTIGDTIDTRDDKGAVLVRHNLERAFAMLHGLDAGAHLAAG